MNTKRIPRVLIAAPRSGGGKTTVTCGLLQALVNRDLNTCSFKVGPDYIDPLFHREIIGTKGSNLDLFFIDEKKLKGLMAEVSEESEISVIEGVMGYYDGLGGKSTESSAYDVARATKTPVILVIDVNGASLSLCAEINGFKDFKKDSNIKGVILNKCSKMMNMLIKDTIEELCEVKVLGYVPKDERYALESRHLGLVNSFEVENLKNKLNILSDQIEETVDVKAVIELANSAPELEYEDILIEKVTEEKPVIAVAKDKAFCFYYKENLDLLEKLGAKIKYFSPLEDETVPEDASAIYLGGGYPELHLGKLEGNSSMRNSIKDKIRSGMPVFSECGGFMYLLDKLEGKKMVGLLQGEGENTKKLSRFGYITITAKKNNIMCKKGESIKGHEFHYFDTTNNGSDFEAVKAFGRRGWECVHAYDNVFIGFPHLYFYSNVEFPKNFVLAAENYMKR
ncbi:MAG: cobyrinate a,c-diamide synthase [Clostridiales bacterium]|nr:cobyrinate a,c-diamide synthase [Clostridiales bacterium]